MVDLHCARLGVVVNRTSLADPDDIFPLRVHLDPVGSQPVLLSLDHLTEWLVIGYVADKVIRHAVTFSAHEEVLDQVCQSESRPKSDQRPSPKCVNSGSYSQPKKVSFRGNTLTLRSISPSTIKASSSALKM